MERRSDLVFFFCIFMIAVQIHSTNSKKEKEPDSIGSFWHVTDFHYDPQYSETGVASAMCHESWIQHDSLGKFGNYKCDAPWTLVQSAIGAMKQFAPTPDFILWTGDSVPHVDVTELSVPQNVRIIGNITDLLIHEFNKTSIFPSLGNHDPYPVNQMPFGSEDYFKLVLNTSGWNKLLKEDAQTLFLKAGYYSALISPQIKVISLNTAIYYSSDKLTVNVTDPGGQFAWLKDELGLSRSRKEKVFMTGHVPPGAFARVKDIVWMNAAYNKKLIEIFQQFKDIIIAHLYGHEHTDSFRVLKDDKGAAATPFFLAPAVTPWNSTLAGAGFNNPGVRLFTYDRFTGALKDYKQYYLNLPDANKDGKATWLLEYSTLKDYGLKDLTAASMSTLASGFKATPPKYFDNYFKYNAVSSNKDTCSADCKKLHICAITEVDIDLYTKCVNAKEDVKEKTKVTVSQRELDEFDGVVDDSTEILKHETRSIEPISVENHHVHHHLFTNTPSTGSSTWHPHRKHVKVFMYWIIGGLGLAVLLLFVVVMLVCWKKKHVRLGLGHPRYMRGPSLTTKLIN